MNSSVVLILFAVMLCCWAQPEHDKLKKEAKFCHNCLARPLGYLTGKRAAMASHTIRSDTIPDEMGSPSKAHKIPFDRMMAWYRSLVATSGGNADGTDDLTDSREYSYRY